MTKIPCKSSMFLKGTKIKVKILIVTQYPCSVKSKFGTFFSRNANGGAAKSMVCVFDSQIQIYPHTY